MCFLSIIKLVIRNGGEKNLSPLNPRYIFLFSEKREDDNILFVINNNVKINNLYHVVINNNMKINNFYHVVINNNMIEINIHTGIHT
jgi:uncharacterized membrane protein